MKNKILLAIVSLYIFYPKLYSNQDEEYKKKLKEKKEKIEALSERECKRQYFDTLLLHEHYIGSARNHTITLLKAAEALDCFNSEECKTKLREEVEAQSERECKDNYLDLVMSYGAERKSYDDAKMAYMLKSKNLPYGGGSPDQEAILKKICILSSCFSLITSGLSLAGFLATNECFTKIATGSATVVCGLWGILTLLAATAK